MRENPGWFSLIASRLRRVAAPIPVYRWNLISSLKRGNAWTLRNKVAAGRSPVAPATLARQKLRQQEWSWSKR
jgi:hypothetical protein